MSTPHRTIVYIDGYNFYYGRLKDTPYKWLDIVKLFEKRIVREQLPHTEIILIKFFTANIKAKFSSHGELGNQMQQRYHNALTTLYPDKIKIILGYHETNATHMPKWQDTEHVDKKDCLKVWRLIEKQTDVNIALHLYRDAQQGVADAQVICSSDSDLEPALKMIKEDGFPVEIGLVIPRKEHSHRPPNKKLSDLASWTRSHINDEELSQSQLPDTVPTKKKAIKKPHYW